ncbi:MAG: hypothetical protein LBV45_01590 [Xanthomonadaceae bacterium]|jgi:hypothetical protein|nr:hypothetical protein [Xanthomonadaceae bacterium]
MNPTSEKDFDRRARQLHSTALTHLSAPTLAQLRAARHTAAIAISPDQPSTHRFAWPWLLGSACALVLTVAIGAKFMLPAAAPTAMNANVAPAIVLDDTGGNDLATALDDDPGFYLWLASNDFSLL